MEVIRTSSLGIDIHWFPAGRRLPSLTLWMLGMVPKSRRAQAVLAEVLSQALSAGMSMIDALEVASDTMRGSRLRLFLSRVIYMINAGEELIDSFRWAGMPLHEDLRTAFKIGETRGSLHVELAAAARMLDPHINARCASAIGRRNSAKYFAESLARLLSQQPMTISILDEAARKVGRCDRRFRRVIRWLACDVEGGSSLADTLARYPDVFDPLFLRCVAHVKSRESMRRVLIRLSGNGSASELSFAAST
jgi:type II secretory pathway component PulF